MLTQNEPLNLLYQAAPVGAIVLTDGCFDPLHVGHIRYFSVAAGIGKHLVVHVASDDVIRAKGREPFQSREERVATVQALKEVHRVVSNETLADAIRVVRPKYLIKGSDWVDRIPPDVIDACRDTHTMILYTDTQERTSTERLAK